MIVLLPRRSMMRPASVQSNIARKEPGKIAEARFDRAESILFDQDLRHQEERREAAEITGDADGA